MLVACCEGGVALASRKTAAAAPSSIGSPSGVPAKIQQVVGYSLQHITGYSRLQVTGYRLRVTGYRLQVTAGSYKDTTDCQAALSEMSKPSGAYGHAQD